MSDERRQPWMKWYPSDWRADASLRMCSLSARGLWADVLTLMHEATPYGHLLVNSRSPTARQIAALLGCTEREVTKALAELEEAAVFSRTDDGVIYSRRMVRDAEKAARDKANGKNGGNPALKVPDKPKIVELEKPGVNPPHKAQRLEARGQRPEARNQTSDNPAGGGSSEAARDRQAAAAEDLIKAFGDAYRQFVGSDRRRSKRDADTAEAWAEAGYTAELVRAVAGEQIERMAAKGMDPPSQLGIISDDLAAAHAAGRSLSTEPREPDDVVQWRARVRSYAKSKFWSAMWGEPPSDPRCAAPVSILAEFGFRKPQTEAA